MSKAIRNKDGIWINSQVFREEALYFQKYNYYNNDLVGSPDWFEYWTEQRKRCLEGYEVGGVKITGDHYFYLNFCPILKSEESESRITKKVRDFGDFWDGDYEYYWCREIARNGIAKPMLSNEDYIKYLKKTEKQKEDINKKLFESLMLQSKIRPEALNGGYNLIVGKSRRKGYSYKNASIGANNYFHSPERITLYTAYEKRFLYPSKTAIFTMCNSYINFVNSNTAWAMPSDYINKQDHVKASYKQYKDGIEVEKGFKSEVQAISFKDNADALRGKDAYDIIIEEAGAFGTPGLLKSCYMASEDCVKDGVNKTGMITIFGTSGDMEGGTADYAEMFQNPERFDLLPFENVFEEKTKSSIGFFHPVTWNMPGFYDKQGNSDKKSADNIIVKELEDAVNKGATPRHINSKMQEKPRVPSDAFGITGSNLFPVAELKIQRDRVINEKLNTLQGKNCTLEYNSVTKTVDIKVDLSGKVKRIETMTPSDEDKGCVVIWEFPISDAPSGLYKIGYDPVRQDKGTSLMSITVKKSVLSGSFTSDIIVAEFIGRKDSNDENHQIVEYLAMAYNTKIMYENEVPDVKVYFQRRRLLNMLCLQPDKVISKAVKKSNTSRVYGCHMTAEIKDAGERYIRDWLLQIVDYDEDNKPIYRLNKIYSVRLLTELIEYDRKKATKFDYISSLIMCLIQEQEEVLNKEYTDKKKNSKVQQFIDSYKNRINA